MLTEKWARGVLEKFKCNKREGTTGKVDPSPQFLAEENFCSQRNILPVVNEHDIPPYLMNIDQMLLCYVNTGRYKFSFKGAKNVSIRGVENKRLITASFAVNCTADFLPIQLIYSEKPNENFKRFLFLPLFW